MSMPLPSLNIDLKTINTKYPSLQVGQPRVTLIKLECTEDEKKPGSYPMVAQFQLEEPNYTDFDNNPLPVGFKVTAFMKHPGGVFEATAKSTAEENKERALKKFCQFIDAVLHTDQSSRPSDVNPLIADGSLVGKPLLLVVSAQNDPTQAEKYGPTQINGFKPTMD